MLRNINLWYRLSIETSGIIEEDKSTPRLPVQFITLCNRLLLYNLLREPSNRHFLALAYMTHV